ncbi:hypothetical protein OH492_28650 [Vibrio chagasii]|nr:hypothetical protein [Vibrio chagasii]
MCWRSLREFWLSKNGIDKHTASTMIAPAIQRLLEIETGKSTWLLGLAGITAKGAILRLTTPRSKPVQRLILTSSAKEQVKWWARQVLPIARSGAYLLHLLGD